MSITIITVTYNSSKHIADYLKSLVSQNYPKDKLKLILVDNNSVDLVELKQIIEKYNQKLDITTKYRTKNYGFANSCNYGAKFGKDNLLFLNPDTQVLKNSLHILESHMMNNNADICGGKMINTLSGGYHRTVFNYVSLSMMLSEFSNLGKIFHLKSNFYDDQKNIVNDTKVAGIGGGYMMIKKQIFKKLGGFDERFFMYLEDVDLCIRAKNLGYMTLYCPHSTIKHIGGASSNNKHRIAYKAWFESRERYVSKHFPGVLGLFIIVFYKIEYLILRIRQFFLQ